MPTPNHVLWSELKVQREQASHFTSHNEQTYYAEMFTETFNEGAFVFGMKLVIDGMILCFNIEFTVYTCVFFTEKINSVRH